MVVRVSGGSASENGAREDRARRVRAERGKVTKMRGRESGLCKRARLQARKYEGWRGAGRDGKGPVAMDCWKHMCSIMCIVNKVIPSDCATCTGSRAAEGKQRQHTEQGRGRVVEVGMGEHHYHGSPGAWTRRSCCTSAINHARHWSSKSDLRSDTRAAHGAWGGAVAANSPTDTPKVMQKACVVPHRVAHAGTFSPSGSSKGT